MKPATSSISLIIVVILCGYVVANAQGIMKIAAFILGVAAMMLMIYSYWKDKFPR